MNRVILLPLGVGAAFTSRYYTSCYALGVEGEWLLIECPHPVRKMLREGSKSAGLPEPLDLDRIHSVAVSHLHADHCCGLEDLGFFSLFALRKQAKLLMHPEARARLWDNLLAAGMEFMQEKPSGPPTRRELKDYFELIELNPSQPVKCGPFAIECRRTVHSVPTFAFRIQAGGRVLGFSADTAFDPTLIEWLAAADLIVHEVTTKTESAVHTPYVKLAGLHPSLQSKMRLTHFDDDFDVESSAIEPLRQGRIYEV